MFAVPGAGPADELFYLVAPHADYAFAFVAASTGEVLISEADIVVAAVAV